ncbi:MAG: UbiA family prenyltransferase [Moraxellaceae bacterium]|nr:UbiA family prenyltransferase [Moraxellaceae bacterium]
MKTPELSSNSSVAKRFLAWIKERFPFANALLFFILYLTTAAIVRSASIGEITLSLSDVISALVTWSFFLVLRVFDEHKDYELDCKNHPQRVLQSGLITLGHLRIAGSIAIAAQVIWSLLLDNGIGQVSMAWLAMFVWTCLMGKEFFIAEWLNRHLTLYAVSHMLVMPLIVWWLANLAVPGVALTNELQVMMLLAFISGFCFEITRKTKGPEEERDSIESYSRIFGTRGSAFVVTALVSAMVLNQLWLTYLLAGHYPWWAIVILAAFYALSLRQLATFIRAPSASARGKNEAMVALTMLAGYAVLISVAIATHGIAVTLY